MAMFRQPVPAGQPPSLRAIAEAKNAPANFPNDLPYDYAAGAPPTVSGGTYRPDVSETPPKAGTAAFTTKDNAPNPFSGLRSR